MPICELRNRIGGISSARIATFSDVSWCKRCERIRAHCGLLPDAMRSAATRSLEAIEIAEAHLSECTDDEKPSMIGKCFTFIREYFRRELSVVGEAGLEPWRTPWAIYTTGPCSALAICGINFSQIPRRTGNAQKTEADKRDEKMKLLILCILTIAAFATPKPGLLKVPKIYNVVITSDQNLSPSRALPVIQPVIHRTAIGYGGIGVPPFYYTQITPHFVEPAVKHYPLVANGKAIENDQAQASSSTSHLAESTSFDVTKDREDAAITDHMKEDSPKNDDARNFAKKNEQVPLSFYPNYRSFYYEPYIYTYNGFNPHLVPGTYYIDYQPDESLKSISTITRNTDSAHLSSFHDEKRSRTKNDREKIPDVPPPPLPISIPKKS